MTESKPVDRWISETLAAVLDGQPKQVRLVTGYQPPAVTLGSMLEQDKAEGTVFYLLICRECGNGDLVVTFDSPAGRGKWAAAHTRGTGHDRWFVTESTARLSPEQVTEMLARHDWALRGLAAELVTGDFRYLVAGLLELHAVNALTGIRAIIAERLRQVRGEPAEGIDGRAYEAALLAEEIDQEAAR